MMKMEGIITPIVTPFHRDAEQSINYEATEKLINHLIEHGVNGIFILGSNGLCRHSPSRPCQQHLPSSAHLHSKLTYRNYAYRDLLS